MTLPSGQAPFDCVEVRFKMEEKSFIAILKIDFEYGRYCNIASPGHDWNCYFDRRVSTNQMKKKGANLTVMRFRKSIEKHHRKTLISGLLHEKENQ
jgi:hypothetical protein